MGFLLQGNPEGHQGWAPAVNARRDEGCPPSDQVRNAQVPGPVRVVVM